MRITPLDVRKQEFKKIMRGLDANEVYAFLSTVADEYEAVLNDNKALRERLLELDDKVQEYRAIERSLRDTLLTAERVTMEAKDNARREATLIIKEAQLEANKSLRDISADGARLRQEIQRLRSQRDAYLAKMKVVAESHVKFIESAWRDFQTEDRAVADDAREPRKSEPGPARSQRTTGLFDAAPANPQSIPQRTSSIFEEKATEAPPAEGVPGLGDILDRLSQSQRAVLESANDPNAVELPPSAPAPNAAAGDVESEWNMDQFRRDLQNIASTLRQSDDRDT